MTISIKLYNDFDHIFDDGMKKIETIPSIPSILSNLTLRPVR
jgi:hypothetical protein